MIVPFLDLKTQHESLRSEIEKAIGAVLDSTAFAGGPFAVSFEKEFAAFCACSQAAALGSGTEALWLSLLALGVGPGDEVITVPATFMATAEAITYCGATPVFVDIEENTYTMDSRRLVGAITAKTKAIIPVHLFGQTADMDPILEIARAHKLPVIEDACQAHGAAYKGRAAGSLGEAGCFSFYPGKNLGAIGEAGAVVSNHPELMDKVRILRDHGQVKKYHHTMIGWNCRMDGIQAAVLSLKLRHLDRYTELRRAHAARYNRELAGVAGLRLPVQAPYAKHVYHLYPVRVANRDDFMAGLAARGVGTGIHYPIPVHLQEAYRGLGYKPGSFPIAERCAAELVSLPMFPELTPLQLETVIHSVKESLSAG